MRQTRNLLEEVRAMPRCIGIGLSRLRPVMKRQMQAERGPYRCAQSHVVMNRPYSGSRVVNRGAAPLAASFRSQHSPTRRLNQKMRLFAPAPPIQIPEDPDDPGTVGLYRLAMDSLLIRHLAVANNARE
jgi:hypothetical protein